MVVVGRLEDVISPMFAMHAGNLVTKGEIALLGSRRVQRHIRKASLVRYHGEEIREILCHQ